MSFLNSLRERNGQAQLQREREAGMIYEKGLADSANSIAAIMAAKMASEGTPVDLQGFGQPQAPAGLAQQSILANKGI